MKKVAILVANLFDEKELIYPYYRLLEAGFKVDLVGAEAHVTYKSKVGLPMKSDKAAKDVDAKDYDALVIPGGFSPDYMRRDAETVSFARSMDKQNKPIAAICHGPWLMISSCDLKGKTLTGFPSVQVDIENAGATYIDEALVKDGNLITSRTPNDLPVFVKAIIDALS